MFAEHLTQEPFHSLDSVTWLEFSHGTVGYNVKDGAPTQVKRVSAVQEI